MAQTANQISYRDEYIPAFQQNQTFLRDTVTTEAVISGNQATFLVAGNADESAVTRDINGLLPADYLDKSQKTATLQEWHKLLRENDFNVLATQGTADQLIDFMLKESVASINRKIDDQIFDALEAGTVQYNSGNAETGSLKMVLDTFAQLGNNFAANEGDVYAVISYKMNAYLSQTPEFKSREYVGDSRTFGGSPMVRQGFRYIWEGINFIVHPRVPGVGTAAEKCFMYNRAAVGHAMDIAGMDMVVRENEEHAYTYSRASANIGGVLLQNNGVIEMVHNGS